jgi:hypothetical protein
VLKITFNYALRLFALLILMNSAALINTAFGQGNQTERQVAAIRKLYTEVNERIAAGLEDHTLGLHHAMVSVGGEKDGQQWRAVGTMEDRTEFYFDCEPGHTEACGTDPRKLVVKIVTSYRGASDLMSRAEYLFNKQGELVFTLVSDNLAAADSKAIERRYYFASGRMIRVVRGEQTIDRNFTAQDQAGGREAEAQTRRLRNLFAMIFAK